MRFPLSLAILAAGTSAADNDLEKRVEALELASYTNTVSFSGFLETRFERGTKKPESGDKVTHSVNTMVGGIDFKSNPSDRVSIFGRLVFSSLYNPAHNDLTPTTSTFTQGRGYVDSQPYFERFFANIKIIDNLQFSFGRLPTVDGPPFHFSDSLARQGSYPKWIYPAILDGYGLTYTQPIASGHSVAFRIVHSPLSYLKTNFGPGTDFKYDSATTDPAHDMSTGGSITENYRDKVDIKSFMIDYNNGTTSIAKDLNVIIQHMSFTDLQFSTTMDGAYSQNLIYAEATQLLNSGLSLWVAYSMTKIESDGYIAYPNAMAPGGFIPISFMANKADGTADGKGTSLGLNYALPLEALKNPSLGLEYISNDENYVFFELTPRQMFDIYGIHGKVNHVYWSQPIFPGVKLRVGTMMINPTHAWGYIGAPREIKDKYTSVYANLRLDF